MNMEQKSEIEILSELIGDLGDQIKSCASRLELLTLGEDQPENNKEHILDSVKDEMKRQGYITPKE